MVKVSFPMVFIEALAYGHYADCSMFSHNKLSISILFSHVCQFTFSLLPCAQYAQRVMHSLSFVCVCVAIYTLILPVKYLCKNPYCSLIHFICCQRCVARSIKSYKSRVIFLTFLFLKSFPGVPGGLRTLVCMCI